MNMCVKQLAIRTLPANVLLSPSGRIEGKNLSEAAIEKKLKLRIDELQADGGKRMKAADYLRGHPIPVG